MVRDLSAGDLEIQPAMESKSAPPAKTEIVCEFLLSYFLSRLASCGRAIRRCRGEMDPPPEARRSLGLRNPAGPGRCGDVVGADGDRDRQDYLCAALGALFVFRVSPMVSPPAVTRVIGGLNGHRPLPSAAR